MHCKNGIIRNSDTHDNDNTIEPNGSYTTVYQCRTATKTPRAISLKMAKKGSACERFHCTVIDYRLQRHPCGTRQTNGTIASFDFPLCACKSCRVVESSHPRAMTTISNIHIYHCNDCTSVAATCHHPKIIVLGGRPICGAVW